jgi:hypothetical protein
VVRRCPKGLGSPVFDKLEAELAKAMLSLPATKVGGEGPWGRRALAALLAGLGTRKRGADGLEGGAERLGKAWKPKGRLFVPREVREALLEPGRWAQGA